MERYLWSLTATKDDAIRRAISDQPGTIFSTRFLFKARPKGWKKTRKTDGEIYIEPSSDAHRTILKKFKYGRDHYVILMHQVALDEIDNYDYFRLQPRACSPENVRREYSSFFACPGGGGLARHPLKSEGIGIFKPPKRKVDVLWVDGLVFSRDALTVFLKERITEFLYQPCALSAEQKKAYETVDEAEYLSVDAQWWDIKPLPSDTLCTYNGPSRFCNKCGEWVAWPVVSEKVGRIFKREIPTKWRIFYGKNDIVERDIQTVQFIRAQGKECKIANAANMLPIVSRRFLKICAANNLIGYNVPWCKIPRMDLGVIEHCDLDVSWM